jgi:diguanylate cyclase (GGDEF)-like protein
LLRKESIMRTAPSDRYLSVKCPGGLICQMSSSLKMHANFSLDAERGLAMRLMEHLVVPTFVLDAQCRVLIWNKACERLTGLAAADVIGTSDHWRAFYNVRRPCLADLVVARRYTDVRALYANGASAGFSDFGVSAENWCVMPKLGRLLYLAIDAGPIYDDEGEMIAAVETVRDITAQKQAQSELESLATRDGLTGLGNRRSFDERLNVEVRKASRDQKPMALLMIDIDFFKAYNDTYGHQRGDDCLKAVAQTIAGFATRSDDFAARYGGEEFAIILPNTSASSAALMAKRLRRAVANLRLAHSSSAASGYISLSIGGVVFHSRDADPVEILGAADAALYEAKRTGRDRAHIVALGRGAAMLHFA